MESQIIRLKEGIEKTNDECEVYRSKEMATQDTLRKLQRQLRELREDYATLQQKETEANAKKNELEKQLELAEAETVMVRKPFPDTTLLVVSWVLCAEESMRVVKTQ